MTLHEALEGKKWGDAQSLPRAFCKHKQISKYLNVCDEMVAAKSVAWT
jgi:pentatricopeptide repeat protein